MNPSAYSSVFVPFTLSGLDIGQNNWKNERERVHLTRITGWCRHFIFLHISYSTSKSTGGRHIDFFFRYSSGIDRWSEHLHSLVGPIEDWCSTYSFSLEKRESTVFGQLLVWSDNEALVSNSSICSRYLLISTNWAEQYKWSFALTDNFKHLIHWTSEGLIDGQTFGVQKVYLISIDQCTRSHLHLLSLSKHPKKFCAQTTHWNRLKSFTGKKRNILSTQDSQSVT